jgi:hypothetical protein
MKTVHRLATTAACQAELPSRGRCGNRRRDQIMVADLIDARPDSPNDCSTNRFTEGESAPAVGRYINVAPERSVEAERPV